MLTKTLMGFNMKLEYKFKIALHKYPKRWEITPARIHSICGLKSRVLKLTFFSLKMMAKSGL